ncbi:lipoprotein-releasing system transmembrane subunit LolE, partial [Salmonella enterica subsp. enterica serovar Typhimurium]
RILAVVLHGEIEAVNHPWTIWRDALAKVQKVPSIAAPEPYINLTGLAESGPNLRAIQAKGVVPKQDQQASPLPPLAQNHARHHFKAAEQQIIIGKGLAAALHAKQGDWVSIMLPNANVHHKLIQPN